MHLLKRIAAGICIATFASTWPVRAFAQEPNAAVSPTPSSHSRSAGGVKPNSVSYNCSRGYYVGAVDTYLSNGVVETVFCAYSSGHISEVNTDYIKTGGPSVTLRNFWEWTDCSGSAGYSRRYDIGAFVATAGHEYPFTWE